MRIPDWQRVLQRLSDGVIMTDGELHVTYVNPAYEELSGYTLAGWAGRRPNMIASGVTPAATYRQMWQALRDQGSWSGVVINRRRDGGCWYSHLAITRLDERDGMPAGYVGIARDVTFYREAERRLLERLADCGATQESTFLLLAAMAEHTNPRVTEQTLRVQTYTALLLNALPDDAAPQPAMSPERRTQLIRASVLHDIGNVAIPASILSKPARLTAAEYGVIKLHPLIGADLLAAAEGRFQAVADRASDLLQVGREVILYHHERWDGTGYPYGLAGGEIPLTARVVAVADVYDALTSPRAYRRAWSHRQAAQRIHNGSGSQFDPAVVAAFRRVEGDFQRVRRHPGFAAQIPAGVDKEI